jgi:iron(III) transport system permease protein
MLVGFAELRWGGNGRTDRFRHATAAAPVIATRWSGLRERQTLLIAAMLTVVLAALVLPPFVFLLNASMVDAQRGGEYSFANFVAVLGSRHFLESSANSILFAAGSAALALAIGWISAWIVERTDTPLKALAYLTAVISLGTPYILYVTAWLLLLGKAGPINQLYRTLTGTSDVLLDVYSMPGMIMVEGFLWSPLAFLLVGATLRNANPELEEAARVSGAGLWATIQRVTLRLSLPAILALAMLVFIRAIEAFEVPALVGLPGRISVLTTDIYSNMVAKAPPDIGGASALSVLMLVLVMALLAVYGKLSRHAERFATITGKGFRPRPFDLAACAMPQPRRSLSISCCCSWSRSRC